MASADVDAPAWSGVRRRLTAQLLDEAWPRLDWSHASPHHRVLDIGCGDGEATVLELRPRLPAGTWVSAADLSEDLLRQAVTRFKDSGVMFDQLTPYLEHSVVGFLRPYSKVFSFFCLHLVHNQTMALYNMAELLAPGGEAVLALIGRCPLFDVYEEFAKRPQWAPYMRDYKNFMSQYHFRDDFEQLLRTRLTTTGFTVMSCRVYDDFAFSSTNHKEIIDSLEAVVPFAARMPAAVRDSFLLELVAACYTNGTLSVERGAGEWGADLHRWNFAVMVVHAVKNAVA